MYSPQVTIIVITYNGKYHLEKCLPSLNSTLYPNLRTILLDNNSSDGSSNYVKENFPYIEVVRHPSNYGFAKGNNLIIQMALEQGADYVMLLNDDTIILDPNWLSGAIRVAEEDSKTGMIGFDLTTDITHTTPACFAAKDVKRISGCALLIKTSVFRHIGLMDEVYFAYAEESDLEARAIKAGYRLKEINIPLYHAGGGTFSRFPAKFAYLYIRNMIRFSIKNETLVKALIRPLLMFDIAYNPICIQRNEHRVRKRLQTGNGLLNIVVFFAALLWNVVFLPQTLAIRIRDYNRVRTVKLAP